MTDKTRFTSEELIRSGAKYEARKVARITHTRDTIDIDLGPLKYSYYPVSQTEAWFGPDGPINKSETLELLKGVHDAGNDLTATSDLTAQTKAWRERMNLSAWEAAEFIGIPVRTLEGIEQGRPFRYGKMLRLAMLAIQLRETINDF